ncbi:MAG: tetratricopeptide repeat protein [Gaiellaceae bacterium]
MAPRTRVTLVVATVAAAAAAAAVGVTLLQTRGAGRDGAQTGVTRPRAGRPPLLLDLGVRADPEAVALRRASALYDAGRPHAAERVFSRYRSVDGRIGAALARWPDGSLDGLEKLVAAHPGNATAELHLGLAELWAGRTADAVAAWRRAVTAQPDTPAAGHANDLLHPNFPRGLPPFVPSVGPSRALGRLPPDQELAALARAAHAPDARAKLLYGIALQQLGRPLSAEREFAAAAALAPGDPEAQVAAAVGRFTKDHPERAFGRLGPLMRAFPHAATVRFHLGVMLLWLGQVRKATQELQRARALAPRSPIGREAGRFLIRLGTVGTK